MKNIFKTLIVCLVLGSTLACYKDKGNYDLIDYNETSITSVSGRTVILGDTLYLNTTVNFKYPDRDTTAFTYEWRVGDSLVSTERNLAYVPTKAGLIMHYFYITEKATNIVSRFAWQISINSPYKGGFLMLTEKSGNSDLNIVVRSQWTDEDRVVHYDYALYKDIYSSSYPDNPLGTGPQSIYTEAFPDYSADEVLVFQEQEAVFLNGADLSKALYLREDFEGATFPTTAKPIQYVDGASANFVLFDNGEVYWKRNAQIMGGIHQEQFINVPMYFEGTGSSIGSFIRNQPFNSNFVYMYDEEMRRFIGSYTTGGNDYVGGKIYLTNGTPPPDGFVPLDDMGEYELVYSTDYSNSAYYMNILRHETTGEYLYQTYRLAQQFTALSASEHYQEPFAGGSLLRDNSVFYRLYTSSYLFFTSGSKLYFYDVNTKLVKLYHDFGNGDITHLATDANESSVGLVTADGSFYIVALTNEILGSHNPGDTGILYETHGLGTIVDMKWKWGSYYDYIFRRYPA